MLMGQNSRRLAPSLRLDPKRDNGLRGHAQAIVVSRDIGVRHRPGTSDPLLVRRAFLPRYRSVQSDPKARCHYPALDQKAYTYGVGLHLLWSYPVTKRESGSAESFLPRIDDADAALIEVLHIARSQRGTT